MSTNPSLELLRKWTSRKLVFRFILIALILRLILLGFFVYESHRLFPERMIGGFIFKMNDYEYFLGTVDNYFRTGTMTYLDQETPFAGRMPGYGIPYMMIRYFCDQVPGLIILISLQILLSAIATYAFALLALGISGSEFLFKTVFWCFACCAPTIIFDIFTLSESFSVSAMVLFHFFLMRYFLADARKDLLFAGFFLAWAIFLRPFLGTFLLVASLLLLFRTYKRNNLSGVIYRLFLFVLPFTVFETAWITRNYLALGRFIPLETSLSESYGEDGAYRTSAIGVRTLINAWGGETGEFYDGSEGWWFHAASGEQISSYSFEPHVFQAGFTRDSLTELKFIFNESVNKSLPKKSRDSLNMLANQIARQYAADYKQQNPFRYYVINPVKMYGRLLLSNGTRLLILPSFSEMNLFEKAIKLFYLFFYYLCIVGGTAGMIFFLLRKNMHSPPALLVLFHPWIIATTLVFYASFIIVEYRYLLSGFPVFLLFCVLGFANLPVLKKFIPTHSSS